MVNHVQNHIHLAESTGDTPEFAPIYKWTVRNREVQLAFRAEIAESLGGQRFAHVTKQGGLPKLHRDFVYEFKIAEKDGEDAFFYEDLLYSLAGKRVLLVDNYHVNNGENHTGNIRTMLLDQIGSVPPEEPGLNFFYVKVSLKEVD